MTSVGEQRLVVLDAGVVDAGHVVGGEHPDHAGDVVAPRRPAAPSPGRGRAAPAPGRRGARRACGRPGRRCRAPGRSRAAPRSRAALDADDGAVGAVGDRSLRHAADRLGASRPQSLRRLLPSIAARYAAQARWSSIGVPSPRSTAAAASTVSAGPRPARPAPPRCRVPGSAWPPPRRGRSGRGSPRRRRRRARRRRRRWRCRRSAAWRSCGTRRAPAAPREPDRADQLAGRATVSR